MATASIQGVGVLLSMAKRFAWPAAARTDNRSGINAKLSPRSGSALASARSVAIFCFDQYAFGLFHCICWRPYHVECTGSLLTSEVKRHRARLVLGWGTAWEDLRVLPASPVKQRKGSRAGGERREEEEGGRRRRRRRRRRQRQRQRLFLCLPASASAFISCEPLKHLIWQTIDA